MERAGLLDEVDDPDPSASFTLDTLPRATRVDITTRADGGRRRMLVIPQPSPNIASQVIDCSSLAYPLTRERG